MFSVSMFTAAVGSALFRSILSHDKKLHMIKSINDFDDCVAWRFDVQIIYQNMNKDIRKKFVCLWSMSIIAIALFLVSSYRTSSEMFIFGIQISILNHAIHIGTFQNFIFVTGIHNRLKMIMNEFDNLCQRNDSRLESLMRSFVELYEVNRKLNKSFEISQTMNLMQLNGSLLINSYWLGMALLGVPYAIISDAFTFIVPSSIILFSFAKMDRQTLKLTQRMRSNLSSLNLLSAQSEEILILFHRCKFSTKAFGVYDTSYATLNKVSFNIETWI